MRLLNLDVYELLVEIGGILYNVEFDIDWSCSVGEPIIKSICRDGDVINLLDHISNSQLIELEDMIDEHGDKRQWLEDKDEHLLDCYEYMAISNYS